MDYQQAIANLKIAYNNESASKRDQEGKQDWKRAERQAFLDLLQLEGKSRLLEVGAGTGRDSLFFQQHGLQVISTDLSPAMVALCREKGLDAHVMDFLSLDFPAESFDALYALNCLLHVPTSALPAVLEKLRSLLRPGGLFFLGVYGGIEKEGISDKDWHQPPRYFSRHTNEFMQQAVAPYFEVVSFKSIPQQDSAWSFQSMTLRRPA